MLLSDIIGNAFTELGILQPGQALTANMTTIGLQRFNMMIDQFKAERLMIYELKRNTFAIAANIASRTIASSGAQLTAYRPEPIVRAGFVDTNANPTDPQEYRIDVYTDEEWARIGQKSMTSSIVWGLWYQTSYPAGTIYFHPISTIPWTLALYVPTPVSEVDLSNVATALATDIDNPPGYRLGMIRNLAVLLCEPFGRTPTQLLIANAQKDLKIIRRSNIKASILKLPRQLLRRGGRFNIITNEEL